MINMTNPILQAFTWYSGGNAFEHQADINHMEAVLEGPEPLEALWGMVREAFDAGRTFEGSYLANLGSFLRQYQEFQFPALLEHGVNIPIPDTALGRYCLVAWLISVANEANAGLIVPYLADLTAAGFAEYAVLLAREITRRDKATGDTLVKAYLAI